MGHMKLPGKQHLFPSKFFLTNIVADGEFQNILNFNILNMLNFKTFYMLHFKLGKVFNSGLSRFFKGSLPQNFVSSLLNTLFQMFRNI